MKTLKKEAICRMCKLSRICYVHSFTAAKGSCLECLNEKKRIYVSSEEGRMKARLANRRVADRIRLIVLSHYSGGKSHCGCCGESEVKFLAIDHIKGGGQEDRKKRGFGDKFCRSLIKDNFPDGYQILCHNCNLAKGFYGACPHLMV